GTCGERRGWTHCLWSPAWAASWPSGGGVSHWAGSSTPCARWSSEFSPPRPSSRAPTASDISARSRSWPSGTGHVACADPKKHRSDQSSMDISATGMVCSIGLTADTGCAAIRAKIAGFGELPYVDNSGEPIVGSRVPGLDSGLKRRERLVELLAIALE